MPSTAMPSTAMPSTAMPSTAMPSTAMPSTAMPASGVVRYCGRDFTTADVEVIRALTRALPNRARIAQAVCVQLGWTRPDGGSKAMSARVALSRMAADNLITLPPPLTTNANGRHQRHRPPDQGELFTAEPITAALSALGALTFTRVTTRAQSTQYNQLIAAHHYLGYTPLAGAQLRYLVHDQTRRTLAALAFAASAWKCAARDTHLGWDSATRQARLHLIVGNARFLILPHVHVPHLASAILGRLTRQLPTDWHTAYGYTPVLLETFVETGRFAATSYRAANWIRVGATQGRGKLDQHHTRSLPVKDVYLYPLHRRYQSILTAPL